MRTNTRVPLRTLLRLQRTLLPPRKSPERPVVARHEAVEGLALDVLECREESGITTCIAQERESPASEDAAGAEFARFVQCVVPHVGIFAGEHVFGLEADLESIEGRGDKALD